MLTLMSIEHELLRSLDFTDTVKEFALANVNAEKNEKGPFGAAASGQIWS